jgi:hypothetical protein
VNAPVDSLQGALLLATVALAAFAFACLALSQERHWRAVLGVAVPAGPPAASLRISGFVLLAGSLGLALLRDGPSFGILLWSVLVSAAAIAVVAILTWNPNRLRLVAVIVGSLSRLPLSRHDAHRGPSHIRLQR